MGLIMGLGFKNYATFVLTDGLKNNSSWSKYSFLLVVACKGHISVRRHVGGLKAKLHFTSEVTRIKC